MLKLAIIKRFKIILLKLGYKNIVTTTFWIFFTFIFFQGNTLYFVHSREKVEKKFAFLTICQILTLK